jgi:hypothetical protein
MMTHRKEAAMKTTTRGIVHGKTIELLRETGLPDGQEVTVTLEAMAAPLAPGDGIRESAGGWAEDAEELDQYLEWNRQQRKASRRSPDE